MVPASDTKGLASHTPSNGIIDAKRVFPLAYTRGDPPARKHTVQGRATFIPVAVVARNGGWAKRFPSEAALDYNAEARDRKHASPDRLMVIQRAREVRAVLTAHYGDTLPDDDAGRDGLTVMLKYVMQANPCRAVSAMLAEARAWAPWMAYEERRKLVERVASTKPLKLKADALAKKLAVTYVERTLLGLTTIGCCDLTRAERNKLTRRRKTGSERERRRQAGVKSRSEYLASQANSAESREPWKAKGVSRATWYRQTKAERSNGETGSVATVRKDIRRPHTPSQPPWAELGSTKNVVAAKPPPRPVPDSTEPRAVVAADGKSLKN